MKKRIITASVNPTKKLVSRDTCSTTGGGGGGSGGFTRLEDLIDVDIDSDLIADGTLLIFDAETKKWKATTIGEITPQPTTVAKYYVIMNPIDKWVINHNMGTTNFILSIRDGNGNTMFASSSIVDDNTFTIDLATPTAGSVDVHFSINHEVVYIF